MNAKKEKFYCLLVFDETKEIWDVKKQNLWYHEAKSLEEEYGRKQFLTKVIDMNHLKEFINYEYIENSSS